MKIDGKGYKPGYNAQATVCGKNGIIVGINVTNQANDIQQLQPMLDQVENSVPSACEEYFKNGKHLADTGINKIH